MMHPSRNEQHASKSYGNLKKLDWYERRFAPSIFTEQNNKMPLVNLVNDKIHLSYDKAQAKESERLIKRFEQHVREPKEHYEKETTT